jgi:PRC-barrel domain
MRGRRWFIVLGLSLSVAAFASRAEEPQQVVAPPAAVAKEAAPPPSVRVIAPKEAHGVLGRDVRSPTDEGMGRIVDVIVDKTGTVRAAVIDFGGFLGVGSRKIVVEWNALHFGRVNNKGDSITLELTKAQVAAAPEYKEDTPIVVLGAAGNLSPFDYEHEH